ncbi:MULTISPECIES: hypothetical protein [Bradyrhizobium]|jgi:hypothetical protein|uniref:Uncharacterized protein n=1 Tax=Bradyrhizobium barranii subsp. barranii TaxID=2823807 RepID=A0A7Z0QLQ6_9BRAD|nr:MULTISPECIES: hypothetical protein [Bradyrhizobium]MBR0948252.1 hypothetical protein [Bradyrhizobium liaoningense]MBR1034125.1 hypothetical protein [Bradyrhizobium liaoningense]MCD9825659.1 hypothetical protein [Bradyrhizobium japonicum]MCD9898615.1 hypothetical protein [Bradyrhizobium japonicum]MCP1768827.1 hypothetical protein [Bradyrhizobium japonicum]
MAPQTLPTVRVFAPELWGEVDRFANFYGETYKFSDRDRRAVSGVATHLEKAITLRALAVKLRPGLDIDRDQLNKNGFTPAVNSRELSTVIEAAVLELYSSVDCTVKVLHAIYSKGSRSFPGSTRKLFQNIDKVTGGFPEELKDAIRSAHWYNGLLYWRDELTHLATGGCSLDHNTGSVSYMHTGMRQHGNAYIINDVFAWIDDAIEKINAFTGVIFHLLNSTLKSALVQQVCGFVEGRILIRYLDPTEPLDFNSGRCFAYQWFEKPENPTCPIVEHCGAYKRKMPPGPPVTAA